MSSDSSGFSPWKTVTVGTIGWAGAAKVKLLRSDIYVSDACKLAIDVMCFERAQNGRRELRVV